MISNELTKNQFTKISHIVYQYSGITLNDGKEALVRARLMKRLRALEMENVDEYMQFLESKKGAQELSFMIDAMTTNKTSFFREMSHFDFLRETILPNLKTNKMRFWSAACSSGEEPFSLAILLREKVPNIDAKDVRILATDISAEMLEKVKTSVYSKENIRDIPIPLIKKYFVKNQQGNAFRVANSIRNMVRPAQLNLMTNSWPMKGKFNVIFCRNVMIYFDRSTQEMLVNRFWKLLETGGYLFVGHSEGLSGVSHKFQYVKPATYRK